MQSETYSIVCCLEHGLLEMGGHLLHHDSRQLAVVSRGEQRCEAAQHAVHIHDQGLAERVIGLVTSELFLKSGDLVLNRECTYAFC